MRFLFVTTVGSTMSFFISLTKKLIGEGHTVDIAANDTIKPVPGIYSELGCRVFRISCMRTPLSINNLKAVRELRAIAVNGGYDIVHCHTPVAGVCARLACRSLRKKGLRVFYTAHGFHFYRGAPLINRLAYYPIERLCSRFTDTLITINREDFDLAERKMHAQRAAYINGVGVELSYFRSPVKDRNLMRRELGIPENAFLLISVGELNHNKNHSLVIRALSKLEDKRVHYLIVGVGPLMDELISLSRKLGVSDRVHLAGFRTDMPEVYHCADVNVLPSVREGLGLAAIEGMAAGLPLICSENRGTREYACAYRDAGFDCFCGDADDYRDAIVKLMEDDELRRRLSEAGQSIAEPFSAERADAAMLKLYFE